MISLGDAEPIPRELPTAIFTLLLAGTKVKINNGMNLPATGTQAVLEGATNVLNLKGLGLAGESYPLLMCMTFYTEFRSNSEGA